MALDIGWTFGDEMSRLGLEVVQGDGADNWWVDRAKIAKYGVGEE